MKKRPDIIDIITKIIIITLGLVIIYFLIQLIFSRSPELSHVNTMFIVMIITVLFYVYREVGEIKIGMKYGFSNTKESFTKIKEDIDSIKSNVELIKKKLKVYPNALR